MSSAANEGYCDRCGQVVPVEHRSDNGSEYLVKKCPKCGDGEIRVSSDREAYYRKRRYDLFNPGETHPGFSFGCTECENSFRPHKVHVEVTNFCNMRCPICFNKEQRARLKFDPPLEYFDRIFEHLSKREPRPGLGLFGGEPTVRDDMLDIIRSAQKYGLQAGITTNGVRLADEEYCKEILSTGVTMALQFDGLRPLPYRLLRGDESLLGKKLKALENIRKYTRSKIAIAYTIAKGINDQDISELIQFCHEWRDIIHSVYLIPLVKTWGDGDTEIDWQDGDRLSCEGVEKCVEECLGQPVEFLPAGSMGILEPLRWIRKGPFEFEGVHPNCESASLLVSKNGEYVPLSSFLKDSLFDMADDLMKIGAGAGSYNTPSHSTQSSAWGRIAAPIKNGIRNARFAATTLKHIDFESIGVGQSSAKLKAAGRILLSIGRNGKLKETLKDITKLGSSMRLVVLPYQDVSHEESHRMERCQAGMGYIDPDSDSVKTVPLCSWSTHRNETMRKITERYQAPHASEEPASAHSLTG